MWHGMNNMSILQEGNGLSLRQNSITESNVNQNTRNCVSRTGVKISTIHQDNVFQNTMLK